MHAVVLGGVHHHAAPPTPDVQQPLPWLQPELAADEVELGGLGGVELVVRVLEVGARVGHRSVEPERVELRGQVVVKPDCRAVTLPGVTPPVKTRLGCQRLQRRSGSEADRHPQQCRQSGDQAPARDAVDNLEERLERLDVDVTLDVGASEAAVGSGVEEPVESAPRVHRQHESSAVGRARRRTVPEPQLPLVGAQNVPHDIGQPLGGSGRLVGDRRRRGLRFCRGLRPRLHVDRHVCHP